MPIYSGQMDVAPAEEDIGTMSATFGQQMSETIEGGFTDSLTAGLIRSIAIQNAKYGVIPGVEGPQPDLPADAFGSDMPLEDAKKKVSDNHLKLNLGTSPTIKSGVLDMMMNTERDRVERQTTIERGPHNLFAGTATLGTSFLVGALDPINIGLASIPVVGEANYARWLESAGQSIIGRAAVRGGVGAVSGAAFGAATIPLEYYINSEEGRDYRMTDALLSIVEGAGQFAGMNAGFGLIGDIFRRATGRALRMPADAMKPSPDKVYFPEGYFIQEPGRIYEEPSPWNFTIPEIYQLPLQAKKDAMQAAVAAVVEDRPVRSAELVAEAAKNDPPIAERVRPEEPLPIFAQPRPLDEFASNFAYERKPLEPNDRRVVNISNNLDPLVKETSKKFPQIAKTLEQISKDLSAANDTGIDVESVIERLDNQIALVEKNGGGSYLTRRIGQMLDDVIELRDKPFTDEMAHRSEVSILHGYYEQFFNEVVNPKAGTVGASMSLKERLEAAKMHLERLNNTIEANKGKPQGGGNRQLLTEKLAYEDAVSALEKSQPRKVPTPAAPTYEELPTLTEPPKITEPSLFQHVRSVGKLKPTPDVLSIFGRHRPDLMNKDTGLTLDQMLPGVVQAGFIHDQGRISGGELTSRPEDLANLLREEESGNRQFRLGAEDARATQALSRKRQELMTDLNAELHGLGTSYASLPKKMTDRALYIMYADGKDAETAYNQAIMEQDYYAEKAGTIRRHPANKTENEPAGPSGAGPDDTRGQRAGGTSAGARSAGEVGRQESWRTLSDLARDDAAEREALEASKAADAVPMPASITKDKALAAATAAEQAAAEEVKLHYDAGTLPEATKQALDDELLKIDQTTKDWSNALETATTCLIGGMFGTI